MSYTLFQTLLLWGQKVQELSDRFDRIGPLDEVEAEDAYRNKLALSRELNKLAAAHPSSALIRQLCLDLNALKVGDLAYAQTVSDFDWRTRLRVEALAFKWAFESCPPGELEKNAQKWMRRVSKVRLVRRRDLARKAQAMAASCANRADSAGWRS